MGYNQTSFLTKKFIFQRQFVETYGLYSKGLSPKSLKLGKDFEERKVEKVFRSCITKNGYWYTWCGDEEIIMEVESKGSKFKTSGYNLGRYLINLNPLNMLID
jgi:hypothetical protein